MPTLDAVCDHTPVVEMEQQQILYNKLLEQQQLNPQTERSIQPKAHAWEARFVSRELTAGNWLWFKSGHELCTALGHSRKSINSQCELTRMKSRGIAKPQTLPNRFRGRDGEWLEGWVARTALTHFKATPPGLRANAASAPPVEPPFAARCPLKDAGDVTGREVPESSMGGETTCIVCFTGDKTHVAVPCGHQTVCGPCSKKIRACPICRAKAQLWVHVRIA